MIKSKKDYLTCDKTDINSLIVLISFDTIKLISNLNMNEIIFFKFLFLFLSKNLIKVKLSF